jgi:nucleotide-binding universal stress UspA family protein
VCIDFSLPSKRALEYAALVASKSRGRLLVIHALEWSEESEGAPRDGMAPLPTSEQDALTLLNDLVTDGVRAKCDPELIVGYGIAADEVLRVAKERQADLVVLGTQGRNAFDLALFGSTAQQVVRAATCPVLMVNGLRRVSVG